MIHDKNDLILAIRNGFPPIPVPEKGISAYEDAVPEDIDLADQLRHRAWKDLAPEEAYEIPACFLLSPVLAILLPAFMLDSLEYNRSGHRIEEMLLIYQGEERITEVANALTPQQRLIFLDYLKFAESKGDSQASPAIACWLPLCE